MSNSLILTTFVSSGQHETQKQKFDGTKLPIVVERHRAPNRWYELTFSRQIDLPELASTMILTAPLSKRLGDSQSGSIDPAALC
jgi:hypothetical protein